jgi:predicted amidohydrolase
MSDTEESSVRKGQGPKVAIAQIDPTLGDLNANMDKHREVIARAKQEGADLLVFPELSLTGYRLKDSVPEVALTRQCPELLELGDLSKDLSIVAGLVLESTEHFFFNASVYFEDGKVHFLHRKVYLPTYGMFDEGRYFASGESLKTFDAPWGRTGLLICEDFWHLSAPWLLSLQGMEVLIVISVSPVKGLDASKRLRSLETWAELGRVTARHLGVWVVYANRAGYEEGWAFQGGSYICSPAGDFVARGRPLKEDFIVATLPEAALRKARLMTPLMRDERLDLVQQEIERIVAERSAEERPFPAGGRAKR